uniref:Beta-glucuronidase n=1 Tax=Timema tahoe TaxID=61484 RepID=A0A7R9FJR1_9NEOP|nr:unnamed protein product [Timema tahoe]
MIATLIFGGVFLYSFSQIFGDISPGGILYPRESESREVRSLDGVWNFRLSPMDEPTQGLTQQWYQQELRKTGDIVPMPVPASYNDIGPNVTFRTFWGLAWYDRTFFAPSSWKDQRVWVRFGSVCYAAQVWVNGKEVASHEIGHLPFSGEISRALNYGGNNVITVAVNNTPDQTTVPQGRINSVKTSDGIKHVLYFNFDFFQYSGIDRPVYLYTTPRVYIDDISVMTDIENDTGVVNFNVSILGLSEDSEEPSIAVNLYDRDGQVVAESTGAEGALRVPDANLWWPYIMHPKPAYLYTLEVIILGVIVNGNESDVYRHPVGIRTVSWTNTSLLINNHPFYLRGFGRHEDSDIRGKGVDYSLITKDYNLIKWFGANGYRTSHYPYAEEILDFSDRQGIMGLSLVDDHISSGFSDELLNNHKTSLSELIRRDKNRPSVIMWSIANEADTDEDDAVPYFKEVVTHVKSLDRTRAVTQAINKSYKTDKVAQFLDVICINEYYGWGSTVGIQEVVKHQVMVDVTSWHQLHNKPVVVSEYGTDTMAGYHSLPSSGGSEEYQMEVMSQQFEAFDEAHSEGYLAGEMIWNFADFMTDQRTKRVNGNRKGMLTRTRQPKASAHLLRWRYHSLARKLDNATIARPADSDTHFYVSSWFARSPQGAGEL